jgi:hypothetical protein
MRFHGFWILTGIAGTNRQAPKPEATQNFSNRSFREQHSKFALNLGRQINPTPTNHPVDFKVRTGFHPLRHLGHLLVREPPGAARCLAIRKSLRAVLVVPMHPIPKRLTIHARHSRRFGSRDALQNKRYGQQPARRFRIVRGNRQPAQRHRVMISAKDFYRQTQAPMHQ